MREIPVMITFPDGSSGYLMMSEFVLRDLDMSNPDIHRRFIRAQQEELERKIRETRGRRQRPEYTFSFTSGGQSYRDFFFEDAFFTPPPRQERPKPPPKKSPRQRVAELAGVEWPTDISDRSLFRRAQRKCHPDTGGTHDLWLELMRLQSELNLT